MNDIDRILSRISDLNDSSKSEVCPATNTTHTYMVEVTIGYVETSTIQSYTLLGKIVSRKTL